MARKTTPKLFPKRPLCSGKQRYATEAEALQVAAEQELLQFAENLSLSAYRCLSCGGWHLTRRQKSVY